MPIAAPISTLPVGPIHSLSTAYLRKKATPRKIASTPMRLNQLPPIRDSRSLPSFDLLNDTVDDEAARHRCSSADLGGAGGALCGGGTPSTLREGGCAGDVPLTG